MVFFKQTRTLLCHFDSNEISESFDISSFMELFIHEGPFVSISDNIFGMTQPDYREKIFSITFKPDDASTSAIKKMINTYSQRQLIVPKNGTPMHMWVDEPAPPPATITLYPVPMDIPDEEIVHLVRSQHWGILRRFKFGSHKGFPQFHNDYLHLQIDQLNENLIPKQIIINSQPVSVTLPGSPIRKCAYCRNFGHLIQNCNKRKNKNPPPSNNKSALLQTQRGVVNNQLQVKPRYHPPFRRSNPTLLQTLW